MGEAIDRRRIAFIGFGEAGGILAKGLVASGRHDVVAYDLLLDDREKSEAMRSKARGLGVEPARSAAAAAAGAAVVVSAVTAASSRSVAEDAGSYLRPGQFFLDLNSVSPETKRGNARAAERSGADYVEAAVMAAVPPSGLKVPMLFAGRRADELKVLLDPAGMNLELVGTEVGEASAVKMCRSIMIKGLEALAVECFMTARLYGVEDRIVASLDKTFPHMNWERSAGYLLGRVVEHGRRRAEEMREVAATIEDLGLAPLMATAAADRQQWIADRVAEAPALRQAEDAEWRKTLDAIARGARLRRIR